MGDNEYYEQVLRVLTALDRSDLKALPITNEKWYEIDYKENTFGKRGKLARMLYSTKYKSKS